MINQSQPPSKSSLIAALARQHAEALEQRKRVHADRESRDHLRNLLTNNFPLSGDRTISQHAADVSAWLVSVCETIAEQGLSDRLERLQGPPLALAALQEDSAAALLIEAAEVAESAYWDCCVWLRNNLWRAILTPEEASQEDDGIRGESENPPITPMAEPSGEAIEDDPQAESLRKGSAEVLAWLAENQATSIATAQSAAACAARMEVSASTVKRGVHDLIERGLAKVVVGSRGGYYLTSAGRELALRLHEL